MSYPFVEQLHKKAVPVERLCRVLGVSRSGYYGACQRAKLAPKACPVSAQLKAKFAASGRVYGSRRLGAVLRAQGLTIGRYRCVFRPIVTTRSGNVTGDFGSVTDRSGVVTAGVWRV